jgi:hypothetical protein
LTFPAPARIVRRDDMDKHTPHRETLSQELARLVETAPADEPLTLNRLLASTGGRGLFLVVILLSLPFITPIPLPGVSTVLGLIIGVLAVRLAMGLPPRLPKSLGERSLEGGFTRKVVSGSVKMLSVIEKLAKPRRSTWLAWPAVRFANAALVALMAFLLMLPFPPFPPFTNSMPAYSIILLAASMMEEDGVLIWVGYTVSVGTAVYIMLILSVLEAAFQRLYNYFFSVLLLG